MCLCVAKPVAVELRCHATALIKTVTLLTFLAHYFGIFSLPNVRFERKFTDQ